MLNRHILNSSIPGTIARIKRDNNFLVIILNKEKAKGIFRIVCPKNMILAFHIGLNAELNDKNRFIIVGEEDECDIIWSPESSWRDLNDFVLHFRQANLLIGIHQYLQMVIDELCIVLNFSNTSDRAPLIDDNKGQEKTLYQILYHCTDL